jgi:hypothetical protein
MPTKTFLSIAVVIAAALGAAIDQHLIPADYAGIAAGVATFLGLLTNPKK